MNPFLERVGFLAPDWKDLLEIAVVAVVFYRILVVLVGTRAIQMLFGLVSLVGIYFVSRVLNLRLLQELLEYLFQYGAIAALIVFQPELRSALAHLGQTRLMRLFTRLEQSEVAEEIAEAVDELSRSKAGAIIALEREVGLGEYVETGTPMQARVSAPLLTTIFTPYSPLHDGAVIIRGDTIVAAGAILPLTQFPIPDRSLGTRHRAALGLSEETDALVLVVSEETSTVSVAFRGQLQRGLNHQQVVETIAAHGRALSAAAVV